MTFIHSVISIFKVKMCYEDKISPELFQNITSEILDNNNYVCANEYLSYHMVKNGMQLYKV